MGRLVFLALGVVLLALTAVFWFNFLVKPIRAVVQGERTMVSVTHCDTGGKLTTCYATWRGKAPGSGELSGEGKPGQRIAAYVNQGVAYGTAFHDWTGRVVIGLVGLGFAVIARYLLGTAVRTRR